MIRVVYKVQQLVHIHIYIYRLNNKIIKDFSCYGRE